MKGAGGFTGGGGDKSEETESPKSPSNGGRKLKADNDTHQEGNRKDNQALKQDLDTFQKGLNHDSLKFKTTVSSFGDIHD